MALTKPLLKTVISPPPTPRLRKAKSATPEGQSRLALHNLEATIESSSENKDYPPRKKIRRSCPSSSSSTPRCVNRRNLYSDNYNYLLSSGKSLSLRSSSCSSTPIGDDILHHSVNSRGLEALMPGAGSRITLHTPSSSFIPPRAPHKSSTPLSRVFVEPYTELSSTQLIYSSNSSATSSIASSTVSSAKSNARSSGSSVNCCGSARCTIRKGGSIVSRANRNSPGMATAGPGSLKSLSSSPTSVKRNLEMYINDLFELEEIIGVGSFGKVFRAKRKDDQQYYAVKRSHEPFKSENDRNLRLEEVRIVRSLGPHPNCVQLYNAWQSGGYLYTVGELCELGNLKEYAETYELTPEYISLYLVELACGLKHIHDGGVVHLDIKPANIFLTNHWSVKIGDFGIAHELKNGCNFQWIEGDSIYLAPELLHNNVGKPADVFSLGLTMLELICEREMPKNGELWQALRRNNIPEDWLKEGKADESLAKLVRIMMHQNPLERPVVGKVLEKAQELLQKHNILHSDILLGEDATSDCKPAGLDIGKEIVRDCSKVVFRKPTDPHLKTMEEGNVALNPLNSSTMSMASSCDESSSPDGLLSTREPFVVFINSTPNSSTRNCRALFNLNASPSPPATTGEERPKTNDETDLEPKGDKVDGFTDFLVKARPSRIERTLRDNSLCGGTNLLTAFEDVDNISAEQN
eukprot:Nk52_evm30s272 gene=Nk52_evmTU30s272